jgi:hypothetical protein
MSLSSAEEADAPVEGRNFALLALTAVSGPSPLSSHSLYMGHQVTCTIP